MSLVCELHLPYEEVREYKTFKAWSDLGYRVMKGSKCSVISIDGDFLFHSSQVHKPDASAFQNDYDIDIHSRYN